MMKIDVHAHWFPPALSAAHQSLTGRPAWPLHPADLADRVEDLDNAGVDRQILGSGHVQPYSHDRAAAATTARLFNDLYAEQVRTHGGRFGAFAALPLPHIDASLAEVARCLDELGFSGIGLGSSVLGAELIDASMEPLWAELDRRGATVFIHPVVTPERVPIAPDPYRMAATFGGPSEAAIAAAQLAVSGVSQRYPGIRWVIATMGGTLPLLWRRLEMNSELLGRDDVLADDPAAELRKFFYDTTLSDAPAAFALMREFVGNDQLVFGTDSPKTRVADWLSTIRELVPRADFDLVAGGTARDRLGL
jgi:predicted TIM-barrel fold metal-dependent hydrolase